MILLFYYFQIQNYVFLLKDISKLSEPGAVVNETVTSQHDTGRLCDMFHSLSTNYSKLYDTDLFFRYIVCDMCWPTIHGALKVMNNETINEYSKRIYKYSTDKDVDPQRQKGFLASCISHSTHRYTRGLKRYVKFSDIEHKVFAVCCFSLLANSTELKTTKVIFSLMCEVFIRQMDDKTCSNARKALQQLIELRPNDKTEIIKCVNENYPGVFVIDTTLNETESNDTELIQVDGWFTFDKKSTIKNSSPFTNVFLEIQTQCESEAESPDTSGEENVLFNPELINYLQKFYMPYIFIWGAFIFRNMDPTYSITKIDQGCIEKYFGTNKRIRGHLPIVPARHVLLSLKYVLANCVMFTQSSKNQKIDLESNSGDEETVSQAASRWSSKNIIKSTTNKKNLILAVKKKNNMGFSRPQKTLQHFTSSTQPSKKIKIDPVVLLKPTPDQSADSPRPSNEGQVEKQVSNSNSLNNSFVDLDEDIKIEKSCEYVPKKKFFFCVSKQFKTTQEIYQHNKGAKHLKNVEGTKTKFVVCDDIITNKDYELLTSEKGWLSDSVSFELNLKTLLYILF